jgi:hypothetical protein
MDVSSILANIRKFGLEFVGLYYGSYPAYVINNEDPRGMNMIQVSLPTLLNPTSELPWALPKGVFSGDNYGAQCLPVVGDMVWVEFQMGRLKNPIWSHYFPSKGSKPEEFKSTKVYGFKTPKGHIITLDDDLDTITVIHSKGGEISLDEDGIYLSSTAVINISNGSTKVQITEEGVNIDSDKGIYLGGSKQVLYAKLPDLSVITDLSQVGISNKVKVG